MKAGREHRVPLPERAVEILSTLAETKIGDHVFPGAQQERDPRGRRCRSWANGYVIL